MMMVNRNIKNADDLRAEISRLKLLQKEQEGYLKDQYDLFQDKLTAPLNFVKRISSWFPKMSSPSPIQTPYSKHSQSDWLTNSLRVGLPILFNKVLFRKAGVIKKALLLLASQKAAGAINKDTIVGIVDKISAFIKPSAPRRPKNVRKETDYGIPPDSETY